jgi:redox-sensitive bicupin YhaK (pirin superfamily)
VDVRRAGDRARTRLDWLDSRHSFSFGDHYDPGNTHFGILLVSNEDIVAPGTGFGGHPHRDMEILTWVLEGALAHEDSHGHRGVLTRGIAQRMSAGTGVVHSERNAADAGPDGTAAHFVQMWVPPDEIGLRPSYQQVDLGAALTSSGLVTVASGMPRYRESAAMGIRQRDAALHVARIPAGGWLPVPVAPYLHLFVAAGAIELEGTGRLDAGDAARITGADGHRVTAVTAAELLIWEMAATLAG